MKFKKGDLVTVPDRNHRPHDPKEVGVVFNVTSPSRIWVRFKVNVEGRNKWFYREKELRHINGLQLAVIKAKKR
jgi:hypothetical protein